MGNNDLANLLSLFRRNVSVPPWTTVELGAVHLLSAILNKPSWWTKVADAEIVDRWRAEAAQQGASDKTINYVISQVQYLAAHQVSTVAGGATIAPGPVLLTFVSPDLIAADVRQRLVEQVAVLEDVPELHKDWHPGSDKQVLDLVHPSLFPLVYHQTLIKLDPVKKSLQRVQPPWHDFVGSGNQVARVPHRGITGPHSLKSTRFQWLPAEVHLDQNGTPTIESYINNLHPLHHKDLYQTLADIFQLFIPLFEKQLTVLNTPFPDKVIDVDMYDLYEAESEPPSDTDEVAFQAWEQQRRYKPITMPETFTPPEPIPETARVFLKGRWLQVIFKLANIHLTPDRPEYPGGAWHIEGTSNESIVATGIYYYDCHNIEEVSLDFRTAVTEPNYEQGDERGLERVYGFGDGQPLNQNLGSIKTRHGQCIVFPNIFQHHVSAFRLVDPTLPGHRKILCMFLVDPSKTS